MKESRSRLQKLSEYKELGCKNNRGKCRIRHEKLTAMWPVNMALGSDPGIHEKILYKHFFIDPDKLTSYFGATALCTWALLAFESLLNWKYKP